MVDSREQPDGPKTGFDFGEFATTHETGRSETLPVPTGQQTDSRIGTVQPATLRESTAQTVADESKDIMNLALPPGQEAKPHGEHLGDLREGSQKA